MFNGQKIIDLFEACAIDTQGPRIKNAKETGNVTEWFPRAAKRNIR
jgi:hypothetical protein